MSKGPIQRIQDSIHGLMEFRGMETLVVDVLRTPELQRLRRIRQLGLAHLVFPGAEHSRLVHSLGAAWLAVRFGRQLIDTTRGFLIDVLRPSPSSIRDFAVAALCHDLGHGPLSHAWEREVIGDKYDFDKWAAKLGLNDSYKTLLKGAKWHELVTGAFLIWPDGQLHRLLERTESKASERVVRLLRGQYYLPYLPRLLSGDVDVDRADFIRRDTQQSGVAYGRYDLDWLLSTCTVGKTQYGELVSGFDFRKSVRAIEQFLIARQALYETVYYHKTVHSAEGMVAMFLKRVKDVVHEGGKFQTDVMLKPYLKMMAGEVLDQFELLRLDDFSLMVLIDALASSKPVDLTVEDLGRRILARDLFKIVPCTTEQADEILGRQGGYEEIYDAIKPFCPGNPRYYLVVDRGVFGMFCSRKEEMAYLVDESRSATPIVSHPKLRGYDKTDRFTRLFTIADAVDAVTKLVRR